ncbi:xanthine dehydrogenase family protein molybdopterin-binding subunit [Mesorhizobium sp. B2-3-3]|nr:xanthine dehydrogenase family protein molybdopterin-binding subunit [Mesorhizobium sp. B2-3-3]
MPLRHLRAHPRSHPGRLDTVDLARSRTMRFAYQPDKGHLSRRTFLRASAVAAGGLLVSLHFDLPALAQNAEALPAPPDAYIHIKPDGRIVIAVRHIEMGQGVLTSLPMIVAEELDADWSQVSAELAPAGDAYRAPPLGIQSTSGSWSVRYGYQQHREFGARIRAMLVGAAADRWKVRPDECRTEAGVVRGPGGQSAGYGELADDAARRPMPEQVVLKNPGDFRIIGKSTRRMDSRPKTDGSQKFALDIDLPGMKIALIARPPVFGARVKAFDAQAVRSMEGVRDVFEIPLVKGSAVAVVADRFWSAKQARDQLKIDWDFSSVERADSQELRARYQALAKTRGTVALSRGDKTALSKTTPSQHLVAEYELPYLAAAALECLNMTLRYDGDRAEAWIPSQFATLDQGVLAQALGLDPSQVTLHVVFAGGGFGRRSPLDGPVPFEAAAIAKRLRGTPIKLMYTREDDMRSGYYRPMTTHRVEIGIGGDGMPWAWQHVAVGQSFIIGTAMEKTFIKDGVDPLVIEGAVNNKYRIPNFEVSVHHPAVSVPVYTLRSVGHSQNTFVMETLIDELAVRAKADPFAYRLKLLDPEATKVRDALTLLEEKSRWRNNLASGRAAGIACADYWDTGIACAAEVSVVDNRPRVHRVTVAIACGLPVNPLSIEAQCQGAIGFGLTQLMSAITLKDGEVEQSNFDGFRPPYMSDAPAAIDVYIVPSNDAPLGVGEPATPVISPAVVNALASLTGKRYRILPIDDV